MAFRVRKVLGTFEKRAPDHVSAVQDERSILTNSFEAEMGDERFIAVGSRCR